MDNDCSPTFPAQELGGSRKDVIKMWIYSRFLKLTRVQEKAEKLKEKYSHCY